MLAVRSLLLLAVLSLPLAFGGPPDLPDGRARGEKLIPSYRTPAGLKVELFAAEPMLASPVAISLDEKGRVYVAEEYRFNLGTEENRTRAFFLDDDLQIRTLDDRLKMFRKFSGKFEGGMDWFTKHSDRVRRLVDTKGAGKADVSTVFADGFNDPLSGLAAGVLAWEDSVYLTNIPDLWELKDTKNVGKADVRKSLHRGFGVNCGFLGHDLHGLTFGPDGKLYFSVGDRGFDLTTYENKHLEGPRVGAVFRCDPDGKNLEVVHRGLRNPQELAFDQFGNLFADDNNCDKGDAARLVYVVEDGDSGWNMAYQSIQPPYMAGPWFAERMWHPYNPGQPAWIVPNVGKIGNGPSGFAFTSGTSLPDRYRNRFFMANYVGNGGIESWGVKPQGAGFEIVDYHDFFKPISATDVTFGYDGKMYISDFVNLLWNGGSAGGRIYTVFDPEKLKSPVVVETKKLFEEGFHQRNAEELSKLLEHEDMRVRQRAQFALAKRGAQTIPAFVEVLSKSKNQLAKLHCLWGLAQIARTSPEAWTGIAAELKNPDAEVRAQACKVLADCRVPEVSAALVGLVADPAPRVAYFAAQAVGKRAQVDAIPAIVAMLRTNNDKDPYLRHAGVIALKNMNAPDAVHAFAKDPADAVRIAVVLVERRNADPRLVEFVTDANPMIVAEAVRAIHDLPIEGLTESLASLAGQWKDKSFPEMEPALRRVLHAAYRLGRPQDLVQIAGAISNPLWPQNVRIEAIHMLRDWAVPSPRDRVTGFWRPLAPRSGDPVRELLLEKFPSILGAVGSNAKVQSEFVRLLARLTIPVPAARLDGWLKDETAAVGLRVSALKMLRSPAAIDLALASALPELRSEAREILSELDPKKALPAFLALLDDAKATASEKQRAIVLLPNFKAPDAGRKLDRLAADLAEGKATPSLQLEILETIKTASNPARQASRTKYESGLPATDKVARFGVSLEGGSADRGREIFLGNTAAQCVRCHAVDATGSAINAGPNLSKVVARNPIETRRYLLESMLEPNAKIASGFGTVTLTLSSGKALSGTLLEETPKRLTIQTGTGEKIGVEVADIEERSKMTSAMPSVERTLSTAELRDLVEYLMTLK